MESISVPHLKSVILAVHAISDGMCQSSSVKITNFKIWLKIQNHLPWYTINILYIYIYFIIIIFRHTLETFSMPKNMYGWDLLSFKYFFHKS